MTPVRTQTDGRQGPVVLVHGGAGSRVDDADAMAAGCAAAARAGWAALAVGADALDAAVVAVGVLEDDPLFNAGTGAALTSAGTVELDASVMEGTALTSGAVAGLGPFGHPAQVALAVCRRSEHVLLVGAGADRFAEAAGFEPSTEDAMTTERARAVLRRVLTARGEPDRLDTVGAVVLAPDGSTAAATSTGGVVGQTPGRVGDSPVVGAGTSADDEAGAAAATGRGEVLLTAGTTRTALDRLRAGDDAPGAARAAVEQLTGRLTGPGGVVVVDRAGRAGVARNTVAMPWAAAREDGLVTTGH